MFRAQVAVIRRSKLHYTASGIITPIDVVIPETVFLVGFCTELIFFPADFQKNDEYQNSRIPFLWEPGCLVLRDGQADEEWI